MTSNELETSEGLESSLIGLMLGTRASEVLSLAQVQRLSPGALAYIGDAVYELYVRRCYLFPPQRLEAYHRQVVAQVRAESQAQQLRSLESHLTPAELDILKRGRNAAYNRSRRADPEIYQQASSLETLIGYLYVTDPQRLFALLSLLDLHPPQVKS